MIVKDWYRQVAALFVRPDSIYKQLPGVLPYDVYRDARTFPGFAPVVAHPPCRTWGRLRAFAKAPSWEHGMALWAVEQVRQWGGVLEHPAHSTLWGAAQMPLPGEPPDRQGGYTIEVCQWWWGHRAEKKTWLYIVGLPIRELPAIPAPPAGHPPRVIGSSKARGARPEVTKREREATPIAFATWLLSVARATHPQLTESARAALARACARREERP